MSKTFRPVGDRILVRLVHQERIGRIWLPDNVKGPARDSSQEGIVVALGSGVRTKKGQYRPFDVIVGDRVMVRYQKDGCEIRMRNQEHLLVPEDRILGILDTQSHLHVLPAREENVA